MRCDIGLGVYIYVMCMYVFMYVCYEDCIYIYI